MHINTRRLVVAALTGAFCLVPCVLFARHTRINRIPNVDAKVVGKLKKKKLLNTSNLYQHTIGWTSGQVDKWAKKLRVDKDALHFAVSVSHVLTIPAVSSKAAVYLVSGCNKTRLNAVASAHNEGLLKCMTAYHARHKLLKDLPDLDTIEGWITAAKTAAEVNVKVAWSTTINIAQLHVAFARWHPRTDPKLRATIVKRFKKAKLANNLQIFEALNLSGDRDKFAKRHKLSMDIVTWYAAIADLTRLKGIGTRVAQLLYAGRVASLATLKSRRGPELTAKLATVNQARRIRKDDLSEDEVQTLIDAAKPLRTH